MLVVVADVVVAVALARRSRRMGRDVYRKLVQTSEGDCEVLTV